MGRPPLHDVRRKQLVEATITAISTHGLADATVSRISSAAGVSPSIVHHYFTDKDELIQAAMRSLLLVLQTSILSRLRDTNDPIERITAIVDGNFSTDQTSVEGVRAWLALWSRAPHASGIARLQRINSARTRSNLLHALRKVLPVEHARIVAANLTALMDGLWLRCALDREGFSPQEARRHALEFVSSEIAAFECESALAASAGEEKQE
ncbi:MAG: transcriptional regulator BetI [Pseudomonadota bacterium]